MQMKEDQKLSLQVILLIQLSMILDIRGMIFEP